MCRLMSCTRSAATISYSGILRQQQAEGDAALEAGKGSPDAVVEPGAEGQVALRLAL